MTALLIIISVLLAIIVALLWFGFVYIRTVTQEIGKFNRAIVSKLDGIKTEVDRKGHVVDPFKVANKTNSVGAPTRHIIPRNSPDHIRNKHAEEIKAGLGSYGTPE